MDSSAASKPVAASPAVHSPAVHTSTAQGPTADGPAGTLRARIASALAGSVFSASLLRPVAHTLAVLSAAATVLAIALTLSTPAANRALEAGPTPAVGLLAAGVGALIVARAPRNPLARLLIASGVSSAIYSLATAATALGLLSSPSAAWLEWGGWLSTVGWVPGAVLGLVLLPQFFPEGELLSGSAWRFWWGMTLGAAGVLFVFMALTPAAPLFPELSNPLLGGGNGLETETVPALDESWGIVLTGLFAVLSVGSVFNIVQRFHRSTPLERRKTALVLVAWLVLIVASGVGIGWLGCAAAVLYLASILISVAKYGLYDIEVLISRGSSGALVLALLGAAYVVTAAAVGALVGGNGGIGGLNGVNGESGSWIAGLAGTAVVLVLLEPVRRFATRRVRVAFARGRPDAATLAGQISAVARDAGNPGAAVEATVELLRELLHMPGLRVAVGGALETALISASSVALPLSWNAQPVGTVQVTPRKGSAHVAHRDVDLLVQLEPTLALVAHDFLLTLDLEESRRTIVNAREEERKRIRRDLHDGLGPLLAGAAMTMQAAQGKLVADVPAQTSVQQMLGQASADLSQAVADIRSLVDGLRPASLDDLGLVAAIHASLPESALPSDALTDASLTDSSLTDASLTDSGLRLTVTTHGETSKLPAAIEVAALRIVQEALTNVVRHARASAVTVVLARAEGELHITVDDDGTWLPPSSGHSGVGLDSVRERASELGGHAEIGPRRGGRGGTGGSATGTRVHAILPLDGSS